MEKTYLLALVEDETGKFFIANSKEDRLFFENWKKGMNQRFYTIAFNTLQVSEENFDAALKALKAIDTSQKETITENARKAYVYYDYKFRNVSDKTELLLNYGRN